MTTKSGMDVLLTQRGKPLKCGESVRFTLVKGSSFVESKDPVSSKAPPETFPLVMKFGESVVRPDFSSDPWIKGRLYQQDTPKAQDDSDEEASTTAPKKRKWTRRPEAPKRQWILQEQSDFLETMIAKRSKKVQKEVQSSKYVSVAESNASTYVVMSVAAASDNNSITVTPLPNNCVQSFSQPTKRHGLSMTEAEQAINDQRGKMTRYMMHRDGGAQKSSKSRLLGKLTAKVQDEDDVMGDVAFRSKKGGNQKARQELLSSLGGDGVTVDNDGVLGGTNDSEFGGKRRFGRFKAEQGGKAEQKKPASSGMANDGMAMADDFYQRDVQAEYEELDYDANELFDDDDVDLGEGEVMADDGGFAADEEDEFDDDEIFEEQGEGAEGLASVAGFRALLAKARGETPTQDEGEKKEEEGKKEEEAATTTTPATATGQKQSAAPEAALGEAPPPAGAQKNKPTKKPTGVEVDEKGQRLVTLEAIQREIWLHHGAIRVKRLMKIFEITKKAKAERRNKFRDLIKELCTMKHDAVDGNMLVLKQHYSNMG